MTHRISYEVYSLDRKLLKKAADIDALMAYLRSVSYRDMIEVHTLNSRGSLLDVLQADKFVKRHARAEMPQHLQHLCT